MARVHDQLSRESRSDTSGHFLQSCDGFGGIEAKHLRDIQKFHNVHPTLTAFKPRYKGLIFAKLFGKIGLRHPSRFPLLGE